MDDIQKALETLKSTLKHFGISHNELSKTEPLSEVENNPNTRKAYGIDHIMRNNENRKVRIIIDYDADFPEMLIRVFSENSQKEAVEEEDHSHPN